MILPTTTNPNERWPITELRLEGGHDLTSLQKWRAHFGQLP